MLSLSGQVKCAQRVNLKSLAIQELRRGPSGVLRAPAWLRERMRRLREMPPPTIEEVQAQFAASAEQSWRDHLRERKEMGDIVR